MATKTTKNFFYFSKSLIVGYLDNTFDSTPVYPNISVLSVDTTLKEFVLVEDEDTDDQPALSEYTITFTELVDSILDTDEFTANDIKNISSNDGSKFRVEY